MGNRLSSCGPLIRKAYRNEDTPWQNSRKRDGHLLRLWAEVFHVSTSSAGTVRWQQISEDLVPVNISCVQDQPDYVFHITAYNSQVDKILDVRLTQPGTRIGQASECFVYWKDPVTNDTWGLNFTSPADARAFRECCSPAFKFSRKASSSYSLRLESGRQKDQRLMQSNKRRTNSTPASPSHTGHAASSSVSTGGGGGAAAGREPQCTCMTPEQYARLRASQDPRFRAASMTLPRTQSLKRNTSSSGSAVDAVGASASSTTCPTAETGGSCMKAAAAGEVPSSSTSDLKMGVSCANSSSSVYDNVQGGGTMKSRTTVENYATLRHPAPTSNNSNSEPIIKDVISASVGDGGGGGMDDHLTSAAMESKTSAETQTSMATQTTQMSGQQQQQHEVMTGALGQLPSITHRTQQQQVVPQQPIYGQQQYPAVAAQPAQQQQQQQQQTMYNYYNSNPMQGMGVGGAIPRTYAQQQQQQQQQQQAMYHGMLPHQQSQTLNRYGGYGVMAGQQQQLNYGQQAHPIHHYGTLQQQQQQQHHQSMYARGADPFQPHPHAGQMQQHQPHPAYYERAYSVQGDMIGGDGGDIRRSVSGIRGAPSHSSTGSHPHRRDLISSKSVDYSTMMAREGVDDPTSITAGFGGTSSSSNGFVLMDERERNRRLYHRSRSTENVNDYHHAASAAANAANRQNAGVVAMDPFGLDSDALKRMLQPVRSKSRTSMAAVSPNASPLTSPEMGRRSVGSRSVINDGFQSEPEIGSRTPRFYASLSRVAAGGMTGLPQQHQQQQQQQQRHMLATGARSMSVSGGPVSYPAGMNRNVQSIGMLPPVQRTRSDALRQNLERNLYMDLDRGGGRDLETGSPALSDNVLFDSHLCYATTPSSSNGNSDLENNGQLPAVAPPPPAATSPTSRLLLEYEMHLRNTLAKGLDAESCSLHTFEALLSQSMEDLGGSGGIGGGGGRNSSSGGGATAAGLASASDVIGVGGGGERERSSRLIRSDTIGSNRSTSNAMDVVGGSKSANRQGQQQLSTSVGADGLERSVYSERDRGYLSDMSSRANSFYDRADSVRSGYLSDRESQRIGSSGFVQQTSIESNDSRLCYLTSSEMSDDDRLSLTTAVSDDDDGEQSGGGEPQSPFRASRAAASFNCTGAVRKAGFLSVKKWLLRKKHQVELARKRGWRGYWVCLKGTTLLFYPCDSREGKHVEAAPKHLIIVDGAIMQPIPEHPQRDFIFCLSTAFGDAYLFQAPCQAELDTWVNSIHSACAAAFARHRGKTGTLHLLQEEILRLERSIESDQKLKHMAELQLSVVSESESRRQIGAQIAAWEENLERLHCEQYRLRCYMASLQHGELPNPKNLLAHVSRNTKHTLNRLGVFTVSSFHAYICARSPSLLNNLLAGRGATRRRPPIAPVLSRSNSISSRKSQSMAAAAAAAAANTSTGHESGDKLFRVSLSDGQTATVSLKDNMTVEEFLAMACGKRGLNSAEHFVRVKKRREMDNSNHFVPHRTDLIDSYVPSHELVEICAKALYRVELSRNNVDQMWGFSVEAELVENAERQDELCVFVSRVEDRSVAMNHGIIKGDEIMVINGALVGDLDMMYIESVLQEELILSLTIRSCRADPPDVTCLLRSTDDLIDSLVCPPPPSDQLITDDILSNLIVPAPSWHKEAQHQQMPSPSIGNDSPGAFPTILPSQIQQKQSPLEMNAPPVLRPRMSERSSTSTVSDIRRSSPTGSIASSQSVAATPSRQLSDGEKLKKCILELVETERTYVKHLNSLLENYLEPLKQETFLSSTEINALFGNIQEIVAFQRLFQQSLEEAMAVEPNFDQLDHPSQFKNLLFAIGSAFLHHANHFKLYSSFCASHSKAQKVLLPNEGSQALQEFLQSRNPRQQHSSTLESYLIKPIQRILKYPLLLQQLRNLTDSNSSEHQHLIDALKGMEKVAEHINEMQRIHEEYGAIFDHLFRQHQKSCKQPVDLSPSELLYYGGVEWLNISDFLGKVKKGLELHAMCFVFKSAVVFLCKERLRQRKKLMSVTTKSTAPEVEIIRYQVLIPVTEVQVRTAQTKDMESHYLWELIHLKNPLHRRSEKVYQLSNSTAEFRNAFLKTIRQIIRESVRNMSIPPAKPPIAPSSSTGSTPSTSKSDSVGKGSNGSKRNAQRHSTGAIDYDNVEACASGAASTNDADETNEDDKPVVANTFRGRSQTFGENKKVRRVDSMEARDGDPGVKSENEEDAPSGKSGRLGRTPNHLSLSTTSTLSTGSLASQARLIQASRAPQTYTPAVVKPLGSPIWKPRDGGGFGESFTLPRPSKSTDMPGASVAASTKNSYGTLGFPSKK